MAAFIVVLELADEQSFSAQRAAVIAKAPEFGGSYLAQGAADVVVEGSLTPQRVAVIQFEDSANARAFLDTPEYAELQNVRAQAGADVSVILIEGA